MLPAPLPGQPLSVAQAITLFNTVLGDLPLVIEGEVSGYSVNQGKFVFFDLKDEEQEAKLACFMMRYQQTVPLEDGMRVSVHCRPGLHAKSGKFSLTVQKVEPKGEGSLKRAFELLKQKLEKEGLFATERKRPLPRIPERIGVVSSVAAAGYGDFMRVVGERLPGVRFVVAHVAVQGVEAEQEVSYALDYLNSHYELDAIALIRGGGSLEDLQAFNTESVARAIARSKAPVVAGVGHERDVTIADFCADVRAATPTMAAQLLLPGTHELVQQVDRLVQEVARNVAVQGSEVRQRVRGSLDRIRQQMESRLTRSVERVEQLVRSISALSPAATLERGYSLTLLADGTPLRSAQRVPAGTLLYTRLQDGSVTSEVI